MKIVLSGGWSYGNIGDEVIAECMIYLINRNFNNPSITCTAFDTLDFRYHHKIEAVNSVHRILMDGNYTSLNELHSIVESPEKYNLNDYCQLFDENTIFIMSGGGYFVGAWESMYLARLVEIHLAKKYGAKVLLLGQSIGPIVPAFRFLAKEAFSLCDYICVRDNASKMLVDDILGTKTTDVAVDVAVHINDIFEKKHYNDGKKHVSIMLQNFTYYVAAESKMDYHNSFLGKVAKRLFVITFVYNHRVKRIITSLAKRDDIHIDFVQSVQKTDLVPNDYFLKYVDKMCKNIKKENYTIHSGMDVEEFCQCLSGGTATLSMKMHPVVVSASYKVDTIAITQNYKVDDFMDALGRKEYCYKNTKINVEKILTQLNESFNRNEHDEVNNLDCLKEKTMNMFRHAVEIVGCLK